MLALVWLTSVALTDSVRCRVADHNVGRTFHGENREGDDFAQEHSLTQRVE